METFPTYARLVVLQMTDFLDLFKFDAAPLISTLSTLSSFNILL